MNQQFLEWLKDFGPWIISLLALVQVWVIALWKKYRPGKTEIYEKDQIEIGFSGLGPTLSLSGTMRSVHRDVFVSSMEMHVTRKKDNAQVVLDWLAFRPNSMQLQTDDAVRLEMASGFMLRTSDPLRFTIVFNSQDHLQEYKPYLEKLRDAWWKYRQEKVSDGQGEFAGRSAEIEAGMLDETLYQRFFEAGHIAEVYSALTNNFYWQPGEYSVAVKVNVAKPSKSERWDFNFSLSEEESERLKLNSIHSIRENIGLSNYYNFVYSHISRRDA